MLHRSPTCFVRHRFRRGFAQFFFWCPWAVTSRYSTGSPDMHTRISRNGTCTFSEHTCTTGSTTPRSESESHLEDTDLAQGDARTSSIDLRHLVPDVLVDVDRGNVVAARNCTSHWSLWNFEQSLTLCHLVLGYTLNLANQRYRLVLHPFATRVKLFIRSTRSVISSFDIKIVCAYV